MSYGWYFCKKCMNWQKLHETNPPFIWCDHDWETDLLEKYNYATDDSYEKSVKDGEILWRTLKVFAELNKKI